MTANLIEGIINYEIFASKQGVNPPVKQHEIILVGYYVYPYIKKVTEGNGVSKMNKSGLIYAVKGAKFIVPTNLRSKHFLQKHCYQRLVAFGDDLAKWHGVEPLGDGSGQWGIKWDVDILCHVGWQFLIKWDKEYLKYDSMVKEDLRPHDDSMESFAMIQTIATIALAAATGGLGIAAAGLKGSAQIAATAAYNEQMQKQTYPDSGNPHGPKPIDNARMLIATVESAERNQKAYDDAKEGLKESWGQAKSYQLPSLTMGGRAKYNSGILEWAEKEGRQAPLEVYIYVSEHYDNLWRWTMK